MAKVAVSAEMTDLTTAWGLVEVFDEKRILMRSYSITATAADAVHSGKAIPPGCTVEEWSSGLVTVSSRPCTGNQAVKNPDGTVVWNRGITEIGGFVTVESVLFHQDDVAVVGDELQVEMAVVTAFDLPLKVVP